MLVLTAPLVLLGILAIRAGGPGPVFYRQERVTLDGKVFQILKLRTMRVDAEASGAVWAAEKDSRITRAGHDPAAYADRRTSATDQYSEGRDVVRGAAGRNGRCSSRNWRRKFLCIGSGTW